MTIISYKHFYLIEKGLLGIQSKSFQNAGTGLQVDVACASTRLPGRLKDSVQT